MSLSSLVSWVRAEEIRFVGLILSVIRWRAQQRLSVETPLFQIEGRQLRWFRHFMKMRTWSNLICFCFLEFSMLVGQMLSYFVDLSIYITSIFQKYIKTHYVLSQKLTIQTVYVFSEWPMSDTIFTCSTSQWHCIWLDRSLILSDKVHISQPREGDIIIMLSWKSCQHTYIDRWKMECCYETSAWVLVDCLQMWVEVALKDKDKRTV